MLKFLPKRRYRGGVTPTLRALPSWLQDTASPFSVSPVSSGPGPGASTESTVCAPVRSEVSIDSERDHHAPDDTSHETAHVSN